MRLILLGIFFAELLLRAQPEPTQISNNPGEVILTNGPLARIILTPKPSAKPRINGPKKFGVRPGHPFLFAIPATGDRPMVFAAENLPAGLLLDSKSGRITGSVKERGE